MGNLFDNIDTSGSGAITKSQLAAAVQTQNPPPGFKAMGADAIFAQLDPNNTGSVSKSDFVGGMTALMSSMRSQRGAGTAASSGSTASQSLDTSLQALNTLGTPAPDTPKGSLVNALL